MHTMRRACMPCVRGAHNHARHSGRPASFLADASYGTVSLVRPALGQKTSGEREVGCRLWRRRSVFHASAPAAESQRPGGSRAGRALTDALPTASSTHALPFPRRQGVHFQTSCYCLELVGDSSVRLSVNLGEPCFGAAGHCWQGRRNRGATRPSVPAPLRNGSSTHRLNCFVFRTTQRLFVSNWNRVPSIWQAAARTTDIQRAGFPHPSDLRLSLVVTIRLPSALATHQSRDVCLTTIVEFLSTAAGRCLRHRQAFVMVSRALCPLATISTQSLLVGNKQLQEGQGDRRFVTQRALSAFERARRLIATIRQRVTWCLCFAARGCGHLANVRSLPRGAGRPHDRCAHSSHRLFRHLARPIGRPERPCRPRRRAVWPSTVSFLEPGQRCARAHWGTMHSHTSSPDLRAVRLRPVQFRIGPGGRGPERPGRVRTALAKVLAGWLRHHRIEIRTQRSRSLLPSGSVPVVRPPALRSHGEARASHAPTPSNVACTAARCFEAFRSFEVFGSTFGVTLRLSLQRPPPCQVGSGFGPHFPTFRITRDLS
jgi:hypothetical protein